MVVEDAQGQWRDPLSPGHEDLAGAMVIIKVPEGVDVLGLEAAYLTFFEPGFGPARTGDIDTGQATSALQPVGMHVPTHGGIGRQRAEVGVSVNQGGEVVVVETIAPGLVGRILLAQLLSQPFAHRLLSAGVLADLAAERPHRIGPGPAGLMIPALDSGKGKTDRFPGDRMLPGLGGQLLQLAPQLTRARRSGQQRPDNRETQMRPALCS